MVESSIPIAMILLSCGWNARKVAAGGGAMKVVMTCKGSQIQAEESEISNGAIKELHFSLFTLSYQQKYDVL